MCTVTYIPTDNGAIMTSNRDEHFSRSKTIKPLTYFKNNIAITYPKDEKANGTWIGYNQQQTVCILLNGAFEKHISKPRYKHSRGLIIPEILQATNPFYAIEKMELEGIEPFTIILYKGNNLIEYRWDETLLFKNQLSIAKCAIWNSVTLYNKEIQEQNKKALQSIFVTEMSKQSILDFHLNKMYEKQLPDDSNNNGIKTISISQIEMNNSQLFFDYYDLSSQPKNESLKLCI